MRKLLFAMGALSLAGAAAAQTHVSPFTFTADYFRSNSFNTSTGSKYLSGLELGVTQSLVNLPLLGQVDLGGSILFSGALGKSSAEGNLYRIHADYHSPMAGNGGVYFIGGLGIYWAEARNSSFNSKTGVGSEFGVGVPLSSGLPGVPKFSIEARYRLSSVAPSRGFSIGASVSF